MSKRVVWRDDPCGVPGYHLILPSSRRDTSGWNSSDPLRPAGGDRREAAAAADRLGGVQRHAHRSGPAALRHRLRRLDPPARDRPAARPRRQLHQGLLPGPGDRRPHARPRAGRAARSSACASKATPCPLAGAKILRRQGQRDRRRHQQHDLAGPLQRRDRPGHPSSGRSSTSARSCRSRPKGQMRKATVVETAVRRRPRPNSSNHDRLPLPRHAREEVQAVQSAPTDDTGPFKDKDDAAEPRPRRTSRSSTSSRSCSTPSRSTRCSSSSRRWTPAGRTGRSSTSSAASTRRAARSRSFKAPTPLELAHDFLWRHPRRRRRARG